MEESPKGSKAKKELLSSRESLVVDTLKYSTRDPFIRSESTLKGAEELFLSSFTDFHSLRVCVISTDGWAWSLTWSHLGVESVSSMPLSQLADLQLNELGRILDCVLEVLKVPNQVEIISGHVAKWMHI